MIIFPATHYSMGGLWVDFEKDEQTGGMTPVHPRNHATNIPGLYACGECDFAYHGANRLGANSLLSASFSGEVAGDAAVAYTRSLGKSNGELPESTYDAERERQAEINQGIMSSDGGENPFTLHRNLGDLMREHVFVERSNEGLDQALDYHAVATRLQELAIASSFQLVESLAEAIVTVLEREFGITDLCLELSKPGALPGDTVVGVSLQRP